MTRFVLLFLFALQPCKLWASAPAEDKMKLDPLLVSWSENLAIVKLGWEGTQSQSLVSKRQITLARAKYPTQRLYLIVILKNMEMAPLRLEIPDNQNKVALTLESFKEVPKDEFWLFGETPQSQCGGFTSFHLRFLNKKSIYTNFAGLFAWKILKKDLPTAPVLYLTPQLGVDTPKVILSKAFSRSSEVSLGQCARHHGGACPFVFNFLPPETGRTFLIHFKGLRERNLESGAPCPV